MSDTPRTDDVVTGERYESIEDICAAVTLLCQQLERELATLKAEDERLREAQDDDKCPECHHDLAMICGRDDCPLKGGHKTMSDVKTYAYYNKEFCECTDDRHQLFVKKDDYDSLKAENEMKDKFIKAFREYNEWCEGEALQEADDE